MTTTVTHTQVVIFVPVLVYHDNNNQTHTSVEIFVPVLVYHDNNIHIHTN
jgi:hypothetical protein